MANSDQNVSTPPVFVSAVESLFRIKFEYDMAANQENTKCGDYFTESTNSLSISWPNTSWLWLNPPFSNLTEWVKKCSEQMYLGCRIVSIWPLSSDANQIKTWREASVYPITGRLWPNVRALMLCVWNRQIKHSPAGLKWDKKKGTLLQVW
jgi:phage N-6-adenine-methyltransferase